MHAIFSYTTDQWLLFFFIYCFFGWIFESTYVSLCKHGFVNRGFNEGAVPAVREWRDPYAVHPVENRLSCLSGRLLLRLQRWNMSPVCAWRSCSRCVTGTTASRNSNTKDRSACPPPTARGGLTIFLLKVIHPPIERFVLGLPTQAGVGGDPCADGTGGSRYGTFLQGGPGCPGMYW